MLGIDSEGFEHRPVDRDRPVGYPCSKATTHQL